MIWSGSLIQMCNLVFAAAWTLAAVPACTLCPAWRDPSSPAGVVPQVDDYITLQQYTHVRVMLYKESKDKSCIQTFNSKNIHVQLSGCCVITCDIMRLSLHTRKTHLVVVAKD